MTSDPSSIHTYTQAELLRTAKEQSEEELVKKVLEDSMKVVSVEDEMLQVAMKQSMTEHGGGNDDEQYQAALKMSIADFAGKLELMLG